MSPIWLAAAGWAVAALAMAGAWAWQLRTRNAAVADVAWTCLVAGLGITDAVLADGMLGRRVAIASMIGSWGARLAVFLLYDRVLGKPEEGRYAELRRAHGKRADAWFFPLFQAQAAAAVFFSLPVLLTGTNRSPDFAVVELTAAALWVVGFAGESTADRQLLAFRSDPANEGRTCQAGLWRYSRHPNYFFEWVMWMAYALFATAAPYGWIAWVCPAAMLYLLVRVTGIPAAEAQAIRSIGDEYLRYQQTTSAFVPWPPRRPA